MDDDLNSAENGLEGGHSSFHKVGFRLFLPLVTALIRG